MVRPRRSVRNIAARSWCADVRRSLQLINTDEVFGIHTMTRHPIPATATFIGAAGNKLVADVFGDSGSPVLLLHGGGQTRHAWHKTAQEIASKGHTAYALDQRGHGDSDWVANGAYEFSDYAADAKVVAAELARRSGAKPIAIGASLGGIASLLAEGESERDKGVHVFSALVLVDITPRVDLSGVAKVLGFMRANAKEGFASIAEAAPVVADYLPQRPRPKSNEGRIMRARTSSSSSISLIPRAISKTFSGFTRIAASPTTSGSELTLEHTTGVPQAMASSGGNPKPSYLDGKTKPAADS